MKAFFKGVRKHIGKLDAEKLREQYELVADEFARSERLLNILQDGDIRLDADGNVIQSNHAATTLLGGEPSLLLPGLDLPLGKASRREISVTYPEARTLETRTIPFDEDTVVYLRDITAEKARSEEELRAGATKAVSDLAASVAHEIGNPLNAIAMSLQLLKRDPTDTETIDVAISQLQRLNGITRDFLSALRPRKPHLMPGSVADPLKSCLTVLQQQFEDRRVQVTLDIPAALPNTALDASQMEQVFFNILKNALEAIRDGGTVDITIEADDRDVSVRFRDNGIGMDAEQLAHLFEPYRTSKEEGTGLGLMVSKRIVSDHGGTISAESKPGEGTTFTVTIPRLERRIRALK